MRMGRRTKKKSATSTARRLVKDLPSVFKLVFRLLRDRRVSTVNKLLFGAVAVYMVTPVDMIPDFLGVFGWVDDLYLLGIALGRLVGTAGEDVLLEHWDGDAEALGYLVEGIEEMGALLPAPIRMGLDSIADRPGRLGRVGQRSGPSRRRRVKRIRVDDDAQVHIEE